jgi:hypothetical protein
MFYQKSAALQSKNNNSLLRKNMLYKEIAINPRDGFDLVAVWHFDGNKWYLLQSLRPQRAIALARENPETRLVFPTSINPNHLSKQNRQKNSLR